jgi:hypothetical protein
MAQPAGTLYDPEPPADSAYVRVLSNLGKEPVDVLVDGKPRVAQLHAGVASDYLVVEVGQHELSVRPRGGKQDRATATMEFSRGMAVTVAFPTAKAEVVPVLLQDKTNSNKLKAMITVYHLDPSLGPISVGTADGKLKVFTDVGYGKSASLQVNPISVELVAATMQDAREKGRVKLAMAQGGNYSLFILGEGGKTVFSTQENRTEKYVPKK